MIPCANMLLPLSIWCLSTAAVVSALSERWADPEVTLPYGTYQGYHNDSNGINVWRSIRYAAPPTGQLRWRAPQSPENETSGVIDAKDWPYQCLASQIGDLYRAEGIYNPLEPIDNEDCLYLSVYAPANANNLPVYVWFHGGGWAYNSAREFDGQPMVTLSNNSIIQITVQYRLGIFGYLASPDMGDGLNAGLRDAAFSLQWVQDYIHLFGGDPSRVTIGGESAGASFVLNLLAAQASSNGPTLFQNAWAASPGMQAQGSCFGSFWKAQWEAVSAAADCYDDLGCMRNASITQLRMLNSDFSGYTTRGWDNSAAMCVEGPGGYLTAPATALLFNGSTVNVNLAVGGNVNDSYRGVPVSVNPSLNSSTYEQDADALFTDYFLQNWPIAPNDTATMQELVALYPLSDFPNQYQRVSQAQQDSLFECPGQFAANAVLGKGGKSYRYLYANPPGWHAIDNAQEFPIFYLEKEGTANSPTSFESFTGSIVSLVVSGDPSGVPGIRPENDPEWPLWSSGDFKIFNISTPANVSDAYVAPWVNSTWGYRIGTPERCTFWGQLRSRDEGW